MGGPWTREREGEREPTNITTRRRVGGRGRRDRGWHWHYARPSSVGRSRERRERRTGSQHHRPRRRRRRRRRRRKPTDRPTTTAPHTTARTDCTLGGTHPLLRPKGDPSFQGTHLDDRFRGQRWRQRTRRRREQPQKRQKAKLTTIHNTGRMTHEQHQ